MDRVVFYVWGLPCARERKLVVFECVLPAGRWLEPVSIGEGGIGPLVQQLGRILTGIAGRADPVESPVEWTYDPVTVDGDEAPLPRGKEPSKHTPV